MASDAPAPVEVAATPRTRSGFFMAAAFILLPFVTMGGAGALAPTMAGAGVLGVPAPRTTVDIRAGGLPLALGAAFVLWAVLSVLWSPAHPLRDACDFAAAAIGGTLLALTAGRLLPYDKSLAKRAGAVGLAVLVAFIAVERWLDYPIGRLLDPVAAKGGESNEAALKEACQRAVASALICAWGAAALLSALDKVGAFAIAVLLGLCISLSLQFGAPYNAAALGLGVVAALLAFIWPRAIVSIAAQTIAGWIVLAPLLLPTLANLAVSGYRQFAGVDAPFTWQARAESWVFVAGKIRERLLMGWGFESSSNFGDTFPLLGFTLHNIPLHPHNAPLQIWLETGAVGAVLAASALASFGRRAGAALANDRWAAASAAGALVTAAFLANVNAGAWGLWWWGAIAVGAGLVRLARRPV